MSRVDERPLVAHVVYRFDTGGLENGLVNLINHMPADAYRHAVIALTEVTDFRQRVKRDDVQFIALNKPPGHALKLYPRLTRLFRELQPAIVHTRNLAALECVLPAWLAGVPVRLHGEHGRDVEDLDGSSRKYQWLRRAYKPWVTHYVALSNDLAGYLAAKVHVGPRAMSQVYNGVDTQRFRPADGARPAIDGCPFDPQRHWLVGTVGRMQQVKAQPALARAFVDVLQRQPALRERLRLVMIGGGPLRDEVQAIVTAAGVQDLCWLPGERSDVAEIMRTLSCFVLPSLAEGISNTILEAMASALPVIATAVGGNAELVATGASGLIVPPADAKALADALESLAGDPDRAADMGRAGRARAIGQFSLQAMVARYQGLYDQQLRAAHAHPHPTT
ncbi:TIGR03088 family PEP-CTERM/XrtA system glycosyltransferase [Aquincola sp. S2]|uniref:TIGR03088 family PEP-CTERM/XrtA system glycosyltransferase n=1 Tax=Pseudaquabacterium terrae TaxID=2732868 RepID=A0ABX2EC48_9BURK|nr:TIGR03088 family PEP-CTERM/XrtA system glycosyltransferase [Aquabacterium terrae]NRF66503.1 TIGR03088 family PEP-CTERM/XrtA system glycosyltransferase [Aquabacterium terrae]